MNQLNQLKMIKKKVYVACPAGTRSGYGERSRDLLRAMIELKKDEWDIKILPMPWGATPPNALSLDNIKDQPIIDRLYLNNQLPEQPDIWIQISVPNEFQAIGKYNIGITAGIETTVCDPSWIEGCNRMNLIIVSSNHAKKVFEDSKYDKMNDHTKQVEGQLILTTPIEVLFEGVDTDIFKFDSLIPKTILEEVNNIPEDHCFLFVGHWLHGDLGHDRKDVGMLIKTFLESFKNQKNPPALILKSSGATFSVVDREDIISKIERIRKMVTGLYIPNVYLLHGDLTATELNGLYNHPKVKSMISFTKGEGFCRPFAEFLSVGKPLIVPNWSGHLDFVIPKYSTLLPGALSKVHPSAVWNNVILKDSGWFTVQYDYASRVMRDVYKNYKSYFEKSRGSRQYIKTSFSINKMTEVFKQIIDKYEKEVPTMVPLILPSNDKKELPILKKV